MDKLYAHWYYCVISLIRAALYSLSAALPVRNLPRRLAVQVEAYRSLSLPGRIQYRFLKWVTIAAFQVILKSSLSSHVMEL
jgi:hypothetical protein